MPGQLVNDVLAGAGVVHQTDEGGAQLDIGNVLRHVAADAAVYLLDPARVAPARDIGGQRIPLDVHKNRTDDYNAHKMTPKKLILPVFYHTFDICANPARTEKCVQKSAPDAERSDIRGGA